MFKTGCSRRLKMRLGIGFFSLAAAFASAAAPDFGMYGFATLGGGTTGGAGGATVTVSSFADFKKYAEEVETPYVILVKGEINTNIPVKIDESGAVSASGSTSTTYGELVSVGNNKTIIGLGSDAFFNRIGLSIQKKHNIIIRNIKFTMSDVPISKTDENKVVAYRDGAEVTLNDPDCISISADSAATDWAGKSKQGSYNIWIDHCEFYNAATDNKDRYDGLLDAKNNIYNATFSWNYFHDHHKGSLIGNSNGDSLRHEITFHHNYYKNLDARQPMMRYAMSHLYNNYIEGESGSGNGPDIRIGSDVYVEKNHYASLSKAVFGGDEANSGATIIGNKYEGCFTLMSSGCGSKTMKISLNPGATLSAGDTSNVKLDVTIPLGKFKPSEYYSYTADDVGTVKSTVTAYAGVGKISTSEYESGTTGIRKGATAAETFSATARGGSIIVKAAPGTALRLFDLRGNEIYRGTLTSTESLLPARLPKGVYFLKAGAQNIRVNMQ